MSTDLTLLSEALLKNATTDELREWADALPAYARRQSVITINLTDQVISYAGALTAIDKTLATLRAAYAHAGLDPKIEQRYGNTDLTIWHDDDTLRNSLIYHRKQQVEKADAEKAEQD